MNVRALIVSILSGLVIFGAGIGLGMFFQGGNSPVQPQNQTPTMPDSISVLSSSVVPSITARGRVVKIEGMNLTLINQKDSRVIKMRSDAKIYTLVSPPANSASQVKYVNQEMAFKDIKNGDNVDIQLKVLKSGQIEGISAVILPASPAPVANTTAPKK